MHRYHLSRAADKDLSEIYAYTFEKFGEHQADTYFDSLEASLSKLAANPFLGVDVSSLRVGYRRLIHKRHAIYYKATKSTVVIMRVLGPDMSVDEQLL